MSLEAVIESNGNNGMACVKLPGNAAADHNLGRNLTTNSNLNASEFISNRSGLHVQLLSTEEELGSLAAADLVNASGDSSDLADVFDDDDRGIVEKHQPSEHRDSDYLTEAQKLRMQRRRESYFAVKNSTVIVPRSGHKELVRRYASVPANNQICGHANRFSCQQIMSSTEDGSIPCDLQNDDENAECEEEVESDSTTQCDSTSIAADNNTDSKASQTQLNSCHRQLSRMAMHNYLEAVLAVLEVDDRIHVMVRLESVRTDSVRFMAFVLRPIENSTKAMFIPDLVDEVPRRRAQSLGSRSMRKPDLNAHQNMLLVDGKDNSSACGSDLSKWSPIVLGIDVITPIETVRTRCGSETDGQPRLASAKRPIANISLALPICAETSYRLDGDGGFSVSFTTTRNCRYSGNVWRFKPVSIQATYSALSSLKYCCDAARDAILSVHDVHRVAALVAPYERAIAVGDPALAAEWNRHDETEQTGATAWQFALMTQKLDKRDDATELDKENAVNRAASVDLSKLSPTEVRVQLHKTLLRVMMPLDLEEISTKQLRALVEHELSCSLAAHRETFEQCVLVVMGQLEKPSRILDGLYLGSEWNASNLDELRRLNVHYVLNCASECDNFYATQLHYMNVRVYDTLDADLLRFWTETHAFIDEARRGGTACLVHCKMGVSRSASTVIAYCMKQCKWTLNEAYEHVKKCRPIAQPNENFLRQLVTYEGILAASRRRSQLQEPQKTHENSLEDVNDDAGQRASKQVHTKTDVLS